MRKELIYVVDDEPEAIAPVVAALKQIGFENVVTFLYPDHLFSAYDRDNPPSLIISDYRMMPCSGIELLERVKAITPVSKRPELLLTSRFDVPEWNGHFMIKPFRTSHLIRELQARVRGILGLPYLR